MREHEAPSEGPYVVQANPIVMRLLPKYLENRRKDIGILESALAAGDLTLLRKLGHDMRGTGGAYGVLPISHIGEEIEEAALISDLDRIRKAVQALVLFLNRVVDPGATP